MRQFVLSARRRGASQPLRKRIIRRVGLLVTFTLMVGAFGIVIAPTARAATPEETNAANGIVNLLNTLKGLSDFDELGKVIPGTDLVPTGVPGLDLTNVLTSLQNAITGLADKTADNVESAIEGVDNVGSVNLDIDVDIDLSNHRITFSTLRLSRTVTAPLNVSSGTQGSADFFTLGGGSLTGDISLDLASGGTPLVIDLVPSDQAGPGNVVSLVAPVPDIVFDADLSVAGSFSARLGVLDVTASDGPGPLPAAHAAVQITVDWLDPDNNGLVTVDELTTSAPTDLFNASITSGAFQLDVLLSATLTGLVGQTGQVTLDDQDLTNGLDAPSFTLGELGNFTNFTPQDVLAAIAQLAVAMRGLQLKLGNYDLPLVNENLAELANWSDRITKLFTDNGLAQLNSPAELNIEGQDLESKGLTTIEQIVSKLETALGLSAGALGLQYLPADDVVTFTINKSNETFLHQAPTAAVNVADELASAGISGLALKGNASLTVTPSYSLALTVGLDLSDAVADPAIPITDKIFLQIGSGPEFSLDAPVTGSLDLTGLLGFLEVGLTAASNPVTLLGRRASDPNSPMLSIDIASSGSNRLTVGDLFDAMGNLNVTTTGNQLVIDLGNGQTITATANLGVPAFTLNASASVAGLEAAGATVSFEWADLFSGAPSVTTNGAFNDNLLAFDVDPSDPLALFAKILEGVETAFSALQSLDGSGGALGDAFNNELPIVGTSLQDATSFIQKVREALNGLSSNPAGSLQQMEAQVESVILGALDGLDGTIDFPIPQLPNPADFGTGEDYDADAYQAAFQQYLTDLTNFVQDHAGFLDISYEPGNSPGALIVKFDIGVCSDKASHPGCIFEYPLDKPFNLNLGDFGGGLVSADTSGTLGVDYAVMLHAHFGVQLPDVTPNPGGLPTVSGSPELFILDSSKIEAEVAGSAQAQFNATIGPFKIQVGDDNAIPESATAGQCGTDTNDDDGDGFVNDGCPATGNPETGADCSDSAPGAEDDPADADVNDGCPAKANPLEARAGMKFTLANDIGNPGEGDRTTDFGAFLGGLTPSFDASADVDCGDGPNLACADLPITLMVEGGDPKYLGTIAFRQHDFNSAPTFTGADTVFNNLKAAAESFLWDLIAQGIREFGNLIERTLSAGEFGADVPVVGDLLDAGADIGKAFNDNIATPAADLVSSLNSASDFGAIQTTIRDFFWNHVGPNGVNLLLNADDIITNGAATVPVENEDIVVNLKCGNDNHTCDGNNGDTMLDLSDVQVEFKIGQVAGAKTPAFNFGVPGLRLSGGDGTVAATVSWQLNVGFGISLTDGFYLMTSRDIDALDPVDGTDAGEDIQVQATVDLGTPVGTGADVVPDINDRALHGDIAFLGVDVYNAKDDRNDGGADGHDGHELTIDLSVDIPDPSNTDNRLGLTELVTGLDPTDWNISLEANVDLYVTLVTSIDFGTGDNGLPRLLADLSLKWGISGDLTDGVEVGDLEAGFDNVRLDLGSFISEFLGPMISEVQKYTKPLQPIIDTLNAPIPGISQLAELVGADPVTLIDLMEALSGSDLTLLKRLLGVVSLLNSLPAVAPGDTNLLVPLGDFSLDAATLEKPELPANKKGDLISGSNLASGVSGGDGVFGSSQFGNLGSGFGDQLSESRSEGGFTFPAFQNPSELFKLIVGQDVTLVHFDAGPLRAEVSKSFSFGPITVGPVPVSVVVSIGAAVEGHFAIGYDTKGIRQLIANLTDGDDSNNGFWENAGVLFAGVFIDDLDSNGVDVPEIRLVLEAAVGAAVDLVIVKAGVEAGIRATLDLNLHDGGFTNPTPPENLDGKIRIDEILQILTGNPICLFDVSGKLEAFIRVFVTIDLFLFSVTFKQTIVNIVLLELDNITAELCKPPPPVLAEKSGSTLVLNMGERADRRNYDEGNKDEKFTVRQLSEGTSGAKVSVTAFGIEQEYDGVDLVVGSGADGKDKITAEPGALTGVCQDDGVTVKPDIGVGCGDVAPGKQVTKPITFQLPVHFCGGSNDDTLGGGDGADTLRGDGKLNGSLDDCVGGSIGAASDDGADKINGLAGNDTVSGDYGDDDVNGDNGNDTLSGGDGVDQVAGGLGHDTLNGDGGDDHILGGPEADPCPGDDRDLCSIEADDTINGGAGLDQIEGDHGKDTISGGDDADTVVGGLGDDTINGDGGDDSLFANQGNDTANGGTGDDDIIGGTGDDTLNGGANEDDLVGEEGIDTINGDAGYDLILGGLGETNRGPDPNPSGDGFNLLDVNKPLVTLKAGDPSGDFLNGGADPDLIYGQEGGDTIHGNAGADTAHGNEGNDIISGDEDGDQLFGDEGTDTIHGDDPTGSHGASDGVDTVRGGPDGDTIEGNADGDNLFGDGGRDTVFGDAANEAACGIDGNDTIHGGPDGDYLFGNSASDTIFGEGDFDRIVGGSDSAGVCDADDTISGGEGQDVISGDNAVATDTTNADDSVVTQYLDAQGAGDTVHGDNADDLIFGQVGNDTLYGDNGNDYVEGNEATDTISGGAGDDDLIGGSSANDGATAVVDADRNGNGRSDANDVINGDGGNDWIAGDNALIARNKPATGRAGTELFDVATTASTPAAGTGDGDTINGGDGTERIFGQTGPDTIHGDSGTDYIEGNNGDDSIYGDAGNDDLIGGGSANDGVIDDDRIGTTLLDVGETLISGGGGEDYIAGDNALITRAVPSVSAVAIQLFDVFTIAGQANGGTAGTPGAGTSGGEVLISGGDGPDWIFGQGGNDTIHGDAGADYVEGNEGDDAIYGDGDNDDLVGGSSADDGVIDDNRLGNGLRDSSETLISGGDGVDWITGDNALVNRNRPAAGRAPIELFDVQLAGGQAKSTESSGGDFITGDAGDDQIFGQGNGTQPASQTDPADGRNNDFIATGGNNANPDFDRKTGTADEDAAGWLGDIVWAGTGDDYVEGNHGNDLVFGNAPDGMAAAPAANDDEDDLTGGGSADDGKIDNDRLNLGQSLLDGADVIHGDTGLAETGDDDVVLGDNGWIVRTGTTQVGTGPEKDGSNNPIQVNLPNRDTRMGTAPPAGTFGDDYIAGNGGHDDLVGQAGSDALDGEWGSDGVIGDLGKSTVDLLGNGGPADICGTPHTIEPNEPFISEDVCQPGTLFRRVELFKFDETQSDVVAGEDVILGGDGDDWIHGGPGADLINGDGDGGPEIQDPVFTYTQTITDPNPGSTDVDRIFGGDSNGAGQVGTVELGNGDSLWGGRGHDHLYGGHGADNQDVRPAADDPYPDTWGAWAEADIESYHGVDYIYGGFGPDAAQANVADNGPVTGDRIMDWAGVFNLSLLCPATYGAYVTIRDQSPDIITYWEQSADFDGVTDVTTKSSSGFNELAMVYKPDLKDNNNPPYPNTPGHFFACGP